MTELWLPIKRFPYEVSDQGRVRNSETGRILRSYQVRNRNGDLYEKVKLYRHGMRHHCFVHRLVAQAHIPNPKHKPEVDHGDQDTLHNAASNLEWCTRSENEQLKRFMRLTA